MQTSSKENESAAIPSISSEMKGERTKPETSGQTDRNASIKELVVISGKGGTGKTSMVASLAALAPRVVLADCDVDAADLHLIMEPVVNRREDFSGGHLARIRNESCIGCGRCRSLCRFNAIHFGSNGYNNTRKSLHVDPIACEGCGVCHWFCPQQAIEMYPAINGEWYLSETRHGPMVHAKLGIAQENSGKLVSLVRQEARSLADRQGLELVLIDGSPGIGCPVIASITGADLALVVTEPTPSGLHDLQRVAGLTKHFNVTTLVCINKWDLNPAMTSKIEELALQLKLEVVGRIRYDRAVTDAQIRKRAVVEYRNLGCAYDIHETWKSIRRYLPAAEEARN